jgi:hypothetical protein
MVEQDSDFASEFAKYTADIANATVGVAFENERHASKIAVAIDNLLTRVGAPETEETRLTDEMRQAAATVEETPVQLLTEQYPDANDVFLIGSMLLTLSLSLETTKLDKETARDVVRTLKEWLNEDLGVPLPAAEMEAEAS